MRSTKDSISVRRRIQCEREKGAYCCYVHLCFAASLCLCVSPIGNNQLTGRKRGEMRWREEGEKKRRWKAEKRKHTGEGE